MHSTETTLCGYCDEFGADQRRAAAHVQRCPLCKTEVGVTRAGRRFRVVATPVRATALLPALLLSALAIGVLSVAALAWLIAQPHAATELVVLPPEPVPVDGAVPAQALATAPPAATPAPEDVSAAKAYFEGVLSPAARVKVSSPAAVEVASAAALDPASRGAPPRRVFPSQPAPRSLQRQAEDASADLASVPEVALETERDTPLRQSAQAPSAGNSQQLNDARRTALKRVADLAASIHAQNAKAPDGFVVSLKDERPDLAGLPFRLGKSCQLSPADATVLAGASRSIRLALAASLSADSASAKSMSVVSRDSAYVPTAFWSHLDHRMDPAARAAGSAAWHVTVLPGLVQVLGPEHPGYRTSLVSEYRMIRGAEVTAALARLAVYDPQSGVRNEALDALQHRPNTESTEVLLTALRYPWAPVAQRAAEAIAELGRMDLVNALVDVLDEPDPSAPFALEQKGKRMLAVRELVKINHHRNCLLCHAPVGDTASARALPVGPVPSPLDPLPPSNSAVYYRVREGVTAARADVTYLRQDFSMMLPVADADPWPRLQRFDFLIRTRVLTNAELEALKQAAARPPALSLHRQTVLTALRRLTGIDAGTTAAAWRGALAEPSQGRERLSEIAP